MYCSIPDAYGSRSTYWHPTRRQTDAKWLCPTREWSGLSGRNLSWNLECLQSLSSNDCKQNFSCRYAVHGCEKNCPKLGRTVQIRATAHVRDGSAPKQCRCIRPCILAEWVGPEADYAVEDLEIVTHSLTHTHTYTHTIYWIITYIGTKPSSHNA
jgi:hypothetical protein